MLGGKTVAFKDSALRRRLSSLKVYYSTDIRVGLVQRGSIQLQTRTASIAGAIKAQPETVSRWSRDLVENSKFIFIVSTLTIYALVGDDLRLIFTHKPADAYFDLATSVCIFIFTTETLCSCIGKKDYFLSFFCLLDVVATITLVLDLTWVNESIQGDDEELENARASRTARLGARVGSRVLRLMRIVKLYKAIYEARKAKLVKNAESAHDDDDWEDAHLKSNWDTAKGVNEGSLVGKKLTELTIRRVICLVLLMMLILPLLKPPSAQLPTSATYGADLVEQAFERVINASQISGISGVVPPLDPDGLRLKYEKELLRYLYFHNWYTGRAEACTGCESSNSELAHLFWVGIGGQDENQLRALAKQAEVRSDTVGSWQAKAETMENMWYFGGMPESVDTIVHSPWDTVCTSPTGLKRVGFSVLEEFVTADDPPHVAVDHTVRCPEDLRGIERKVFSPLLLQRQRRESWRFMFYFDQRPFVLNESGGNLLVTAFVCVCLLSASMFFSHDATNLVLGPVENMMNKVQIIRADPLRAVRMADEDYKTEQVMKELAERRRLSKTGWDSFKEKIFCDTKVVREAEPMETVVLEKTIMKLGSLLALGFGEAGAVIIGQNMAGESACINPMIPGTPVDCIIGVTRICDFSMATEVLQGHVMRFVNQIAEIVHGVVNEFHGAINQNNGETFLMIWRTTDLSPEKVAKLADMSMMAVTRILAAIHRSPVLAAYRKHPGFQNRLRGSSRCRVNIVTGLHAGWAVEGAVGSEFKIDASYLSPNVSTAEALLPVAAIYNVSILVSEAVRLLCTPEMGAKCRLIDRIRLSGWFFHLELYVVDLDYLQLPVDGTALRIPFNTRQRFKARQQLELARTEKWNDNVTLVSLFHRDADIAMMRFRYTMEFLHVFNMGFQNYLQGEWKVAEGLLRKTSTMLEVEDGPSMALLKYMRLHKYIAPDDWTGVREISRQDQILDG